MPLSYKEKDFLEFVNQFYFTHNNYPDDRILKRYADEQNSTLTEVRKIEQKLSPYLDARGIRNRKSGRLTDKQLAAIHLLVNFIDKRSQDTKLRSIGVTPTQWQGWCKDPVFMAYYRFMTDDMLEVNISAVNNGLIKAAENGNTRAAQFVYEVTGRYQKDSPVANVQVLIVSLIEIIQMHVKDPEILRKIGADFELAIMKERVKSSDSDVRNETPVAPKRVSRLSSAITNSVFDPDDIFG